jgi:hypothetical protein
LQVPSLAAALTPRSDGQITNAFGLSG